MASYCPEQLTGRPFLRYLVGNRDDCPDLEAPLFVRVKAPAQVELRHAREDVRVQTIRVALPHVQLDALQRVALLIAHLAAEEHHVARLFVTVREFVWRLEDGRSLYIEGTLDSRGAACPLSVSDLVDGSLE